MKTIISLNSKYLAIKKKSKLNFLFQIAGKPIIDYLINNSEKLNPEKTYFLIEHQNEKLKKYIKEKYYYINFEFIDISKKDSNFENILKGLIQIKKNYNDDEIIIIQSFGLIDDNFNLVYKNKNTDKDTIILTDKLEKENLNDNLTGNYWFKSFYYLTNLMIEYKEENLNKIIRFRDVIKYIINDDFKISKYEIKKINKYFNLTKINSYLRANNYYLNKRVNSKRSQISKGNLYKSPNYINKTSKIRNSILENSNVSSYASVQNCIIKNSIICENVRLKNLILENSIIYENQEISNPSLKENC